jgi:hypothetical protein
MIPVWKNYFKQEVKKMAGKGRLPVTREEIERISKELRSKASEVAQLITEMRADDIEDLRVTNHTMVIDALDRVTRFIQSCERAINEIRVERRKG